MSELYDVYEFGHFLMCGTDDQVFAETGRKASNIRNQTGWRRDPYVRYRVEQGFGPPRKGEGYPLYWELLAGLPGESERQVSMLARLVAAAGIETRAELVATPIEEMERWDGFGPTKRRLVSKFLGKPVAGEGDVVVFNNGKNNVHVVKGVDGNELLFADGTRAPDYGAMPFKVKPCPLCRSEVEVDCSHVDIDGSYMLEATCQCGLSFLTEGHPNEDSAWTAFDRGWNVSRKPRRYDKHG